MGRLKQSLLDRAEDFAVRVLDVAEVLEGTRVVRRIVDQLVGCGTSVGANLAEADEAMSDPDFFKCIGVSLKESNETRYWLRLIGRKGWVKPSRLTDLRTEAEELKRILGAVLTSKRARKLRTPDHPSDLPVC